MKIVGTGKSDSIKKSKNLKSINKTTDSSFSKLVENSVTMSEVFSASESMNKIDFNIAIPDVLSANSPEYLAKRHADDILEQLEDLRLELLSGQISLTRLRNITTKIENYSSNIQDEKLKEIIDEIHLRAGVEIAKYMRDSK